MATKRAKRESDVTEEFLSKKFTIKDFKFTEKQRALIRLIRDETTKVVFLEGCAGVGKTLTAVFAGLMALRDGSKEKIQYIRAIVESSQSKIGFLPGDLKAKTSPYEGPLQDKLDELLTKSDATKLIIDGAIECLPNNFLRGATFRNSFVIVDEASSFCYKDLVTVLTRIGENCTMIITGDPMQSDIKNSGFTRMIDIFRDIESEENGIRHFAFTSEDIMRSPILRFLMSRLEYQ